MTTMLVDFSYSLDAIAERRVILLAVVVDGVGIVVVIKI